MRDCLFCSIAERKEKAHVIMEDDEHVAFLDIFPSRRGQTVVITKEHFCSYPFDMPEEKYLKLFAFARRVAKLLDRSLGSIRTFLVVEGMEIDHVHIKLYPVYKIESTVSPAEKFYESYDGLLTTAHGPRADEKTLEELVMKITKRKINF